VALFDTGSGGAFPNSGWLPRALATTGVAPGSVTDIFISHAHPDHIGGLVDKSGALVFPAATVHLSAPEWAAMQQNAEAKAITAAITPKVVAFEPGANVIAGVRAVSTIGHTPGHSSYEISSGSEKLFYLGDLAHHAIISVQRPAWSIQFDMDHAAAEAMRQKTLAALAADHERVYGVHFPFPGIGHVTAKGDGLAWQPE
jgi:glyoxylase-like metal-dependent hydrolase (beta-lactamase superfamily II)